MTLESHLLPFAFIDSTLLLLLELKWTSVSWLCFPNEIIYIVLANLRRLLQQRTLADSRVCLYH